MAETIKTIIHWLTTSGIKIVGILISLIILSQLSRWIVKWMEKFVLEKDPLQATEAKKRAHTLGNTLRHALLIIISFIAIMMILGELGIQLGPLLATAGIGALAIGFGAQSLVKDVSNLSKEWSRSVLDIGISYLEDVDQVIALLTQIGKELETEESYRSAILEPLIILGVEKFGESQLVIRMMVKTVPLKQWEVGRELRRRIKNRFDEKGIQIPFPHRVLIWGDPRKGAMGIDH